MNKVRRVGLGDAATAHRLAPQAAGLDRHSHIEWTLR